LQNKANFKMGNINISTARTKAYANEQRTMNNEHYSKQTQSNPISNAQTAYFACRTRDCRGDKAQVLGNKDLAERYHSEILAPVHNPTLADGDFKSAMQAEYSGLRVGNLRVFYIKRITAKTRDVELKVANIGTGCDDENNRAVIPLTTGLRRVFNQNHLTYIRVRMKNSGNVPIAAEQIRQLLHDRHHITPPQTDDFSIVTAAEVAEAARGISGTLTVLLIALAGLSLLIGGVVMMNILLISVTERKPEIGLRRALVVRQD
jgi:ABC-type antimicrobial peptide transport system permease subunit